MTAFQIPDSRKHFVAISCTFNHFAYSKKLERQLQLKKNKMFLSKSKATRIWRKTNKTKAVRVSAEGSRGGIHCWPEQSHKKYFPFYLMLSIIHRKEKLINSTLMKTWAIFYFAAEKSRISICFVTGWFSPSGCLTDVHHICRYLKYLLGLTRFALSKQSGAVGEAVAMKSAKQSEAISAFSTEPQPRLNVARLRH